MVMNTLVLLFVDYEILFIINILFDLRENFGYHISRFFKKIRKKNPAFMNPRKSNGEVARYHCIYICIIIHDNVAYDGFRVLDYV